MAVPTWSLVVAVVVLVVIGGVVLLLRAASRRRAGEAPAVEPAPEAAAAPPSPQPRSFPAAAMTPEVLTRDSLVGRDRPFDPARWDDRPDGVEGTDLGLVGGDEGGAAPPPRAGGIDASFIESLRARRDDAS